MSEGRTMPIAPLLLAVGIIVASGLDAMAVEMTRPFETLEAARLDRIELDKRMKREAAEQKRREREAKAQQEAQRKRNAAAAKAAQDARRRKQGRAVPAGDGPDELRASAEQLRAFITINSFGPKRLAQGATKLLVRRP
jgi:hypothetical protein